jgi:hypothetical protein
VILKLIEREEATRELMDDDLMIGCTVIDDIQEVKLTRVGDAGQAALQVLYRAPHRGTMSETFILKANAYLMNDHGKTIQTFMPGLLKPEASVPA